MELSAEREVMSDEQTGLTKQRAIVAIFVHRLALITHRFDTAHRPLPTAHFFISDGWSSTLR